LYFFANDSKEIILYPFLSNKDATVVFPAAGFDVAQVFRNYGDRVFDIRLKD
jgi:hypothetical protein